MKRILLSVTLVFAVLVSANAQRKLVIIDPTVQGQNTVGPHHPRTPIRTPDVYIEDNILTFDSSCIGCTITLLQDDIIIYSATVEENDNMEGEVVLPDYLIGVFELQLERGSITFVGEIEL